MPNFGITCDCESYEDNIDTILDAFIGVFVVKFVIVCDRIFTTYFLLYILMLLSQIHVEHGNCCSLKGVNHE